MSATRRKRKEDWLDEIDAARAAALVRGAVWASVVWAMAWGAAAWVLS